MRKPPKPPAIFPIPPGTKSTKCRGPNCSAQVYWVDGPNGKRYLVSPDETFGGHPPSATTAGAGVSHFVNCPDSQSFRKGG